MNTEVKSKHGKIPCSPSELYMRFTDMRNFTQAVPEDMKGKVELTADFDKLTAVVQGFSIGVRVADRQPYSKIVYEDDGAPFKFELSLSFGEVEGEPGKTDFSIVAGAELNTMMKMMLKPKIQEALDKLVDGLSTGKMG